MKKILTIAIIATGVAGQAFAADLPARTYTKAPVVAPVYDWSGFYLGANAGYTIAGSKNTNLTGTDNGHDGIGTTLALGLVPGQIATQPSGFIGGGQIGYNWQAGTWVYGLEADIQGVAARDSYGVATIPPATPATFAGSRNLEWLATFRGRLGILAAPDALLYATGGLALGQTDLTFSGSGPAWSPVLASAATSNSVAAGWTIGAGAEWKVTPVWSIKGEYLYYDLGSSDATIVYQYTGSTSTLTSHVENTGHIARIGINYKLSN